MAIRCLFINGVRASRYSYRSRQVVACLGKENVCVCELKTLRVMWLFLFLYGLEMTIFLTAAIIAFVFWGIGEGLILLVVTFLVGGLTYAVGLKPVGRILLRVAVGNATRSYDQFHPNLIVGVSFGAIVATKIDRPKPPALLLSPALERWRRFSGDSERPSLDGFPFVTIIHGTKDVLVPLADSFLACDTTEPGCSRLEVIDDDHRLRMVTDAEFKELLTDCYENGKTAIREHLKKHPTETGVFIPLEAFGSPAAV